MMVCVDGARAMGSHFRQRVEERFGLYLEERDLFWIAQQIQQPEFPTFTYLCETAAQLHLVQLKDEPGTYSLGYVVVAPRKGKLRLLTAFPHRKWPENEKDSTQRKRDYARALRQWKEWKR